MVLIAGCTHNLVHLIQEYITELEMDASLKDIDLLYFEIWRLVAKENVSILIHQKNCAIEHADMLCDYACFLWFHKYFRELTKRL